MARGVWTSFCVAACVALLAVTSCRRKAPSHEPPSPLPHADSAVSAANAGPDTSTAFATWALRQYNTRDSQVREWPMVVRRQGVWTVVVDCVCQPQGIVLPIGDEAGRMVLWRSYCRETDALVVVSSAAHGDSVISIRGVQEFDPLDTVSVQATLVDRRRRIARWVVPRPRDRPDTLYCVHVSAADALPRDVVDCGDQSDIQ
jgi:hypothetical protein